MVDGIELDMYVHRAIGKCQKVKRKRTWHVTYIRAHEGPQVHLRGGTISPLTSLAHHKDHLLGARLRTWTSTAEPAQTDQAWAGLPQLLQRSLFAHLYRFSPAQASWCL